jgi:4-hydroxy-tetrahydrodipicolinate synthase
MQGVIAAVPTPVNAQGKFLEDLFVSHCQWALDNGCDGLNILGSTGEANSFDSATRTQVMQTAADSLDISRLMVGTGTPSLSETIALTTRADDMGYRVALVLPPYYYKPLADDDLFGWYERLHIALGNREIAIYFYNFPQMTGMEIPIAVIKRLHENWPDRFKGIKDSSGQLSYCRELAKTLPDLAVFPSSEVALAEAYQSGFAGCISATTNQTCTLSAELWAGRANPDPKLVLQIEALRTAIASQSLIPSIKYLVARRTGAAEWENLLPPFTAVSSARKVELENLISISGEYR